MNTLPKCQRLACIRKQQEHGQALQKKKEIAKWTKNLPPSSPPICLVLVGHMIIALLDTQRWPYTLATKLSNSGSLTATMERLGMIGVWSSIVTRKILKKLKNVQAKYLAQ